MAWSFVSVGTSAGESANPVSLDANLPSGYQAGDLLLLFAFVRGAAPALTGAPSGYAELFAQASRAYIFGKIATSSSETPPTLATTAGSATVCGCQMAAFRGAPASIVGIVAHTQGVTTVAGSQDIATPALTITTPNTLVIAAGGKESLSNPSVPAGGISAFDELGDEVFDAASDITYTWAYQIQTTATNIASGSFDLTGAATNISRGVVISLVPAVTSNAARLLMLGVG